MLSAACPFVLFPALLTECREGLLRPKRQTLLLPEPFAAVLTDLARHGIVFSPPANSAAPLAPDPGVQFLWNLLAWRPDLLLVIGDKRPQHRGCGANMTISVDLARADKNCQ